MQANNHFIPLESIQIANPCHADWTKMQGDERARFCGTCAKNVYNLSGMSRKQAEKLVEEKEGNLCVRFYRRADGTIITDDCPVGLRAARRPLQWLMTTVVIAIAPLFTFAAVMTGGKLDASKTLSSLRNTQIYQSVSNLINPQPPMGLVAVAGGMSAPPSPTPQPEMGEAPAREILGRFVTPENATIPCEKPAQDL